MRSAAYLQCMELPQLDTAISLMCHSAPTLVGFCHAENSMRVYTRVIDCRLEAQYGHQVQIDSILSAFLMLPAPTMTVLCCPQRDVPFIPLMLEDGYKADGWLGLLLGTRLCEIDCSAENVCARGVGGVCKNLDA